ncbi:uncharacterized protein [Palaemon carinicauda]|uniref:uncharacterized protein n=1 Tax=Palaemon carinicauda TaxID=392227 RepID=UPI0035B676B9
MISKSLLLDMYTRAFSALNMNDRASVAFANDYPKVNEYPSLWEAQLPTPDDFYRSEKSSYSRITKSSETSQEISNDDEEDHGYHSSDSPLSTVGTAPFPENPNLHINICEQKSRSEDEDSQQKIATKHTASPFLEKSVHDQLLCCTNGFFALTNGPFSEFEGNCSCTTRTLVDWQTRVSWTNPAMRHQVKINEATFRSPFRSEKAKKLTVYSIPRLMLLNGADYLRGNVPQGAFSRNVYTESHINFGGENNQISREGSKIYPCPHPSCGRAFQRNEELARHVRIHTGQKPFICQLCNRGFVRRDHLAKHQRTHLPTHAKRTYRCPLQGCVHSYTRSDALTRHMWTAHHIKARQPARPSTRGLSHQNQKISPPKTESVIKANAGRFPTGPDSTSLPPQVPDSDRGEHYAIDGSRSMDAAAETQMKAKAERTLALNSRLSAVYGPNATPLHNPRLKLFASSNTAFRVIKNSRRLLC